MLSVATRRVPATIVARAALVRTYTSSGNEGSVAQSKEFGKRERAQEDEYARRHDAELLRKLKSEIEKKKKELHANESLQAELESKVKGAESK
ncbi:hypothetical protein V8E55_009683 [Tylopilus felleus]